MRTFQLTIGPVQGFIAQARRTRDFWAGSFLLSWLSGVALLAIESQKDSKLVLPRLDAGFRSWLSTGSGEAGTEPQQGLIPNRLKARVGDRFDPERVVASVIGAWLELAERVYTKDLTGQCDGLTRAIWQRQVEGFWELSWTLGADDEPGILDRRKNWRQWMPADEPGLKCMVMEGWQELSGALSGEEARPASYAREFWARIRGTSRHGIASDLRPGEQLCALAFIKRRFARHFDGLRVDLPGGLRVCGWQLATQVPSVGYIAAAHWLTRFITGSDRNDKVGSLSSLLAHGERLAGLPEYSIPLRCVREAVDAAAPAHREVLLKLARLEGDLYYDSNLSNSRLYDDADAARSFQVELGRLRKELSLPQPDRFFAVLRMDGDSVGAYLGGGEAAERDAREARIADALDRFAARVAERVRALDGWPIYAGGDDVLALFPAASALSAALCLRTAFVDCLRECGIDSAVTISAAVLFAPVHSPLTRLLTASHDLLDDIAKQRTGRDALAVQVLKPGGQHLTWAMPWDAALAPPHDGRQVLRVQQIADAIRASAVDGWTSKLAFRLRELIAAFDRDEGGGAFLPTAGPSSSDEGLVDASWLLAAEIADSSANSLTAEPLQQEILALLDQCRDVRRRVENGNVTFECRAGLREDAMLLARFLATEIGEA